MNILKKLGGDLGETRLPTAFLLVYWRRDDTEELPLTLYKAPLSEASYSFFGALLLKLRTLETGEKTSTSPSIMSEVGLFQV